MFIHSTHFKVFLLCQEILGDTKVKNGGHGLCPHEGGKLINNPHKVCSASVAITTMEIRKLNIREKSLHEIPPSAFLFPTKHQANSHHVQYL